MLKLHVLASGSRGNAAIVENAATGYGIAIDCGICKRDFLARCAEAGFDPARIEAVFVTHEHTDHTKGLGVVLRGLAKLGCRPRIWTRAATAAASADVQDAARHADLLFLDGEKAVEEAGMRIAWFPSSHDAAAPFGLRMEAEDDAVGFATDTGIVTSEAYAALRNVRILAIESNHDSRMLEEGAYPYPVKKRIASDEGHLSNDQAARALSRLAGARLETVVAMHISENNNTYDLPREALQSVLDAIGHPAHVLCGYQHRLTSAR